MEVAFDNSRAVARAIATARSIRMVGAPMTDACPYCGKPKVAHAYASSGSCVIVRQARSAAKPSQQEGTETAMGLFGETVKASAAQDRCAVEVKHYLFGWRITDDGIEVLMDPTSTPPITHSEFVLIPWGEVKMMALAREVKRGS